MDFFGTHLSDDLFVESESKTKTDDSSVPYSARIREPQWFLAVNSNADETETSDRYKAQFFYLKKDFNKSSELYKSCLNIDDTNNSPNQRDCLEGLVRSLIKMGRYEESLKYGLILLKNSCNNDQIIVSKSLMALVYHGLSRYKDELTFLQDCIGYHPFNADLWLRVTLCYANFSEKKIPLICSNKTSFLHDTPKTLCTELHTFRDNCFCTTCPCRSTRKYELSNDKYSKIISACIVKSNALYQSSQPKLFANDRKLIAIEKISSVINTLQIPSMFIETVQRKLKEEFKDFQDSDHENKFEKNYGSQTFEEKWLDYVGIITPLFPDSN